MKVRNWDFEQKNIARTSALKAGIETFPNGVKNALFFPSNTCLDIYEAKDIGLINSKTFLIIVEREEKTIKNIKKNLKRLKLKNFYIHNGEIEDLNLTKVLKNKKLEYVFFDICGNLTGKIADWFNINQDNFADNMIIPFTFQIAPRRKRANKRGRKSKNEPTTLMMAIDKNTKNVNDNIVFPSNNNIIESFRYMKSQNLLRDINFIIKTIFYSFSNRNISINNAYIYRDLENKSPLNMIMLNAKLKGQKKENILWEKIVNEHDSKVCNASRIRKNNVVKIVNVKKKGIVMSKSIAEELGIYKYRSYAKVPPQKKAWITIKAKKRGDDPKMVHAGIKATFSKKRK